MDAEIQDSSFLLVNICAPNKTPDQCCFFDKLNNYVKRTVANTAHAHRHLSIFFSEQSSLNVQSKAFSLVGVKIWNGIPTSLKNVSRNRF